MRIQSAVSSSSRADGRMLISGGRSAKVITNATESFDPASGAFTAGPIMGVARATHRATLLSGGRVLIAGGDVNGSTEIFDSTEGSFSVGGATLTTAQSKHTAALLSDGRVLTVGSTGSDGGALSSGEIFDPSDSSFRGAGVMEDTRLKPALRLLPDGKMQIIGCYDHESIEMCDSAIGEFGAHVHVFPVGDEHPKMVQQILNWPTRTWSATTARRRAVKAVHPEVCYGPYKKSLRSLFLNSNLRQHKSFRNITTLQESPSLSCSYWLWRAACSVPRHTMRVYSQARRLE